MQTTNEFTFEESQVTPVLTVDEPELICEEARKIIFLSKELNRTHPVIELSLLMLFIALSLYRFIALSLYR